MNRKNGFWTFCFAFIPGGGQMYQGYMKRGLSLMSMFMFVIFLSAFLGMGLLSLMLPVIWAYSFFDTFNIHGQTPEQAAQVQREWQESQASAPAKKPGKTVREQQYTQREYEDSSEMPEWMRQKWKEMSGGAQ